MLRPRSLQRLVALFQTAQSNHFENYAKELLLMLNRSARLAAAIGRSSLFMQELVARLSFPKAEVRLNLLKMLKVIADRQDSRAELQYLLLEHDLLPVVNALSRDSGRVLVAGMALQLEQDWNALLAGASGDAPGK